MPSTGVDNLYMDAALTEVSIEAGRNDGYLSDRLFPTISAARQSGNVWRIDADGNSKRTQDTARAPGAEANLMDQETDNDVTFFCKDHALQGLIPDEEKAQAEAPLAGAINRTELLTRALLQTKEVEAVSRLTTALASYKLTLDGTDGKYFWDDDTNGDFIANINDGITAIKETQGACVIPNVLAMDESVLRAISQTEEYQARVVPTLAPVSTTSTLDVVAMQLAYMIGIDQVLYAKIALKNTAARTAAGAKTISSIWGNNAFLLYVEPNPGFHTASMGITVTWNGTDVGGVINGYRVEQFREAKRKSDGVIVNRYYRQLVMSPTSGYWFSTVLDPS